MKVVLSDGAIESLTDAPRNVQRAFEKQLRFLVDNLLHPSLHAKKYDESNDVWRARVNKDWRFYFTITDGHMRLLYARQPNRAGALSVGRLIHFLAVPGPSSDYTYIRIMVRWLLSS
jgi:mRNA-degrading endonuclease RelE of RelBE toxin-antitoxin system